jgi:hypothetical protein
MWRRSIRTKYDAPDQKGSEGSNPLPTRSRLLGMKRRTVALAFAVLLLTLIGLPAGPALAQANDGKVKVIVVPSLDQTGGQAVGLRQVAAATLGDQNRAGEIFKLNQGLRQPDGSSLQNPNAGLRPGWILRLPDDASGQLVQIARLTGDDAVQMDNGQTQGGNGSSGLPTAAILAAIGSVLLALITAAIVARRRVAGWSAGLRRALRRFGESGRRRRRLRLRQWLSGHFASDTETVRRAYATVGALAPTPTSPQVHALRVDNAGVTVWISADSVEPKLPTGWQQIEGPRWRSSGTPFAANGEDPLACLVRVGGMVDENSARDAVFVDLSRLDGVLSVTGDPEVARDVVRTLLSEVAAVRPGTPVLVIGNNDSIRIPAGLNQVTSIPAPPAAGLLEDAPVRATAIRRPIQGLVVVTGTPDRQTQADLLRICGSAGAGWTGLVAGEMGAGAHWRWHAVADGEVSIPVLGLDVTVPA